MMMVEGGGSSFDQVHGEARNRRPARACTARTPARLAPLAPAVERSAPRRINSSNEDRDFVTVLTTPPPPTQKRRWHLRSMWELASILSFFHVFRPILNIKVEFTAEELETALITPNGMLGDIHIPLLKAIPPVIRSALGRDTWVSVLCKKLKDRWYQVAEGEFPIVASRGEESIAYKELDPGSRVLILKALCEIRVEQEDIQPHIYSSLKHGVQISAFRNERIGGDSHGTSYWYEDDSIIGHRLYREIRKIEVKNKTKGKGRLSLPVVTCQWETIATNFDEFQAVAEKLASSRNKMEAGVGKKLNNDILPELEKNQKMKEKALKKQQRQATLLDSLISSQGPSSGRSLRYRKPVTYTFDEFDRSISEAIKVTKKKQPSPEPVLRRFPVRHENPAANGRQNGNLEYSGATSSSLRNGSGETDAENTAEPLTRSDRWRRRPQRYSEKEFVEAVSDNEADFDSDEEIVGEAIYDDEYIKRRRRKKSSSSSEGDEEYRGDDENIEEEDDDYGNALSTSEEMDDSHNRKWGHGKNIRWASGRKRKGLKLKSVGELQSGLRRSKRATHNIDYRLYDMSSSEEEYAEDLEKLAGSSNEIDMRKSQSDVSDSADYDMESEDCLDDTPEKHNDGKQFMKSVNAVDGPLGKACFEERTKVTREQPADVKKRRFIDLNELAPFSGHDDGPAA